MIFSPTSADNTSTSFTFLTLLLPSSDVSPSSSLGGGDTRRKVFVSIHPAPPYSTASQFGWIPSNVDVPSCNNKHNCIILQLIPRNSSFYPDWGFKLH
uniref:Uncharacterized protein n=1 Tax=Lepeophtheirus salmonis TaxID=72036 RepID=A0A0K2THS4_LEPSM